MPLQTLILQLIDSCTQRPVSGVKVHVPALNINSIDSDATGLVYLTLPAKTASQYAIELSLYCHRLPGHYDIHIRPKTLASPQVITVIFWPLLQRIQYSLSLELKKQRQTVISAYIAPHIIRLQTIGAEEVVQAIQQLQQHGGGELHLPAGRFEFHESLYLSSHISIIGVPGQTELIFYHTQYGIIIQGSADCPCHQIRLQNLNIRHSGNNKFGAAVFATHTWRLSCQQVNVYHSGAVGFLLADRVFESDFHHCHVKAVGLVGFMFLRDVREIILHGCCAEYCQQGGVFLSDLQCPIEIDPLDFDAQIDYTINTIQNFAPFQIHDPHPYRITIRQCIFRANRKMGITTDGVGYLQVLACTIANNECEGITLDNGSFHCVISDCHIYGNGQRLEQTEHELTEDYIEQMELLPDGSSKAKLPGISLDNAAYCHIENNLIEHNWGDGVKCVRAVYRCHISRNRILNNNRGVNDLFHFFGILLGVAERQHPEQSDFASFGNQVQHNTIIGAHYAGIHLQGGTAENIVSDNTINGATHWQIEDHTAGVNSVFFSI